MRGLETIIGSRVDTSVDVGGLFVPINSLALYLQRFAEPGLYHCHSLDDYPLSKSGSLAKVHYHDRYFALTSHHQSKRPKYDYDELVVANLKRDQYFTSHRAIFPIESETEEYSFDCLAYEFSDLIAAKKLPKDNWYRVSASAAKIPTPEPIIVCTLGYPGFRNSIDYENNVYAAGPNAIWGEQVMPRLTGRLSFRPVEPIEFDPKGMSGSPVFALQLEKGILKLFLAGVLTEASRTIFNFLPLNRIVKALELDHSGNQLKKIEGS